jgi:tetratricopeptide (TPR) repeat protein
VSAFDAGLLLADLLSMVHKPEEARLAYGQLAQENPGQPEVQEALGYMEWHAGNQESARQDFSRAFASGTKSAQMCYDYAMLESQTAAGGKSAIPILRRAVELKPDYVVARLQLGLLLTSERSYSEALDQLHQIPKIDPEQAPAYFLALAYSDLNTDHKDEARKNAESAKKWAKAPGDSEQADSLLRYLDESKASSTRAASAQPEVLTKPLDQPSADGTDPDHPTLRHRPEPGLDVHQTLHRNPFVKQGDQMSHVKGLADRLECDGQSARFYILVGKTRMVFEIPDPTGVLIKHSGEAHHDFTCGVQKPFPVAVDYAVKPDAKKGTAGIVRELDF